MESASEHVMGSQKKRESMAKCGTVSWICWINWWRPWAKTTYVLELFNGLIETGMESMKLGLVPPSMDQLLIGSMDRTRSSGIRYAYILGVNDGVIPAQMA